MTTTADRIRWGILSTGNIAKTFGRALPKSRTATLAAVGSRSKESAEKFGNEFGIPADKCHASYEDLLADPDVDAVYVATPHPLHAKWAILAARAGKHVLCEKPIGVNSAEAMAIFEAAEVAGVFVMEAFMYRCHPQTAKLVELVRSGAIGDVQTIEAPFSFKAGFNPEGRLFANAQAGGGILDVGCYATSLCRLVAGAATGKDFADPDDVSGAAHLGETGVDEWAVGTLKFRRPSDKGGAILGQVRTGVRLNADNTVRVYGTTGRIEVPDCWIPGKEGTPVKMRLVRGGETEEIVTHADRPLYALEADVFAEGVRTGKAPHPAMSAADTLGNMRTLDRWRGACGLTYAFEKADGLPSVNVVGERVQKPAEPGIDHGRIKGLDKPVARFVMGVDNQPSLPYAAVMFDDYFAKGGNAFDTAHVYGRQRSWQLGQWIKSRGVRGDVAVICKGAHTPMCWPHMIRPQLEDQLGWLDTDHADLYFMHRDNEQVPVGEFVDAMNELVDLGLLRGVFGGSNWSLERARAANEYAAKNGKRPMGAMSNNLSLAVMVDPVWAGCVHAHTDAYLAWHRETQTPNFSWSSQARGFFVPERDLEEEEIKRCWVSPDNLERRKRAFELAEKKGVDAINIAAAWVIRQPFPSFALIGPRVLSETRTSLPGLEVELSEKEMAWLDLK